MQVCEWKNLWLDIVEELILSLAWDVKRCLSCIAKNTNKLWPWTFAKHVFPEMCSVFFASFLIFWWKSKSVFFSRGKRKIRKNNNKIQHENLNQQRSPTRQDIRTRRSEFKFCHALKEMKIFCFRWLEWENILSCT